MDKISDMPGFLSLINATELNSAICHSGNFFMGKVYLPGILTPLY